MTTTLDQPQSQVAELLVELGELEQQVFDLSVRSREIKAKMYAEKAKVSTPENRAVFATRAAEHRRVLNRLRYQTNNGLSIYNLRQAGNKVSVSHTRYADMPGVKVAVPVPSYLRGAYDFLPRGGVTHISIVKPDGNWVCVSSVCHIDDSFDYKLGVKTALDQLTNEEAHELLNPVKVEE